MIPDNVGIIYCKHCPREDCQTRLKKYTDTQGVWISQFAFCNTAIVVVAPPSRVKSQTITSLDQILLKASRWLACNIWQRNWMT